ncbi:MAG: ribosomal protein S18-alanine N-acetyltransferase [Ruminococcus sp.]|nr:ribosomal protein S18-alanine N-acetyltransferase [Ruminococcus sp.]
MMRKVDFMDNISFCRITSETDEKIFDILSELDKSCVGADGWTAESFKSESAKDNGIVICCYVGAFVIGLISGYFASDEADITSVAVNFNYRRRGIAGHLIAEFENQLPEYISEIFLEVRESNFPAVSLYKKCGFENLHTRRNFYDNPVENAIVMRKELKKSNNK